MMQNKKKLISKQMILFELRNVTGNPYVHLFGVGMPMLMSFIIIRAVQAESLQSSLLAQIATTIFLGIGTLIPMASILMSYSVSQAQELDKGIPQRMELFGIPRSISLCNRLISEGIFMVAAFAIYFIFGAVVLHIEAPVWSGALLYFVCIVGLSIIFFCIAHAIANMLKKFGATYCVSMILYFLIMILSGMMGLSYEDMPQGMRTAAKLLPTTYINRDFYTVWKGDSYNFAPMIQSYLFLAAVAGILLFAVLRKTARKAH